MLKMTLQLAIKMVSHVNVLIGHPPFQPVNALIMNDRIQGLVTKIPYHLLMHRMSVLVTLILLPDVVISILVIGNGSFAQKTVVLANRSELEHVRNLVMSPVPNLELVSTTIHVFIRQEHVKFKNVSLAPIMLIIVITESILNASMLPLKMAKLRYVELDFTSNLRFMLESCWTVTFRSRLPKPETAGIELANITFSGTYSAKCFTLMCVIF